MKSNNSLISTLFISLMLACNTAVEPITAENDAAIDIESLLESNQKIRIGPVITKSMNRIIECSGRIDVPPSEFISVHSRIKGVIDKVNYLPGDKVSRGDGLFVINDPELVERQRILAETHAKFEQVEKEYDRQKLLYESGATSLKKFENISAERKLLRARFDGLSAELQLIGVDTKPLLEEGSFSTYVIIRSPSNGYVHDVKVNKGQMISPEDVLLEMANDEHIHLELQVLSKDVTSVGLDQKVSFRIPQDTSTYSATLIKLNKMLDHETGTLMAHCHIDEAHLEKVKVGMLAQAQIETEPRMVSGLSRKAVVKEGEEYYGYRKSGDELQKVLLKDAVPTGDFVEFTSKPDEVWVTDGAYYLQ